MRSLAFALLFGLAACTDTNPAFLTDTSPGTTDAGTTGEPTTTTTTTTSTTSTSTTEATMTTGATTSEPVETTGPEPTTTGPATASTSTTDPAESSTGQPDQCLDSFKDGLGPLVHLAGNGQPMPYAQCAPFQEMTFSGRLYVENDAFTVKVDQGCGEPMLPLGLRFPVALPQENVLHQQCVGVKYKAHDVYGPDGPCYIAWVYVKNGQGVPAAWGSFGLAEAFSPGNLLVEYKPDNVCACPGCCGDFPDPDQYTVSLPEHGVTLAMSGTEDIMIESATYRVTNIRSHVHPECDGNLPSPEWLHRDLIAAMIDGN